MGQISIRYGSDAPEAHICTGSLVTPIFVLTTIECVTNSSSLNLDPDTFRSEDADDEGDDVLDDEGDDELDDASTEETTTNLGTTESVTLGDYEEVLPVWKLWLAASGRFSGNSEDGLPRKEVAIEVAKIILHKLSGLALVKAIYPFPMTNALLSLANLPWDKTPNGSSSYMPLQKVDFTTMFDFCEIVNKVANTSKLTIIPVVFSKPNCSLNQGKRKLTMMPSEDDDREKKKRICVLDGGAPFVCGYSKILFGVIKGRRTHCFKYTAEQVLIFIDQFAYWLTHATVDEKVGAYLNCTSGNHHHVLIIILICTVSVRELNETHSRHLCGGSLITPSWVLTAERCLVAVTANGRQPVAPHNRAVLAGRFWRHLHRSSLPVDNSHATGGYPFAGTSTGSASVTIIAPPSSVQFRKASRLLLHEKETDKEHDIALVKVSPFVLTPSVQLANIPWIRGDFGMTSRPPISENEDGIVGKGYAPGGNDDFLNPHQPGRAEPWIPEQEPCSQKVAPLDSLFAGGEEVIAVKEPTVEVSLTSPISDAGNFFPAGGVPLLRLDRRSFSWLFGAEGRSVLSGAS
ncbi:uncharacterized protein LOC113386497 [Ctenocephalides felis]|uniref:uncharacterized protein LOC113386497 n=1 Tax=Ctenocephalides felis TaxID=7515 RepID=UPI000E6E5B9B|nr:uncharacterized protein LOC113386497 [Ctenocephalides felis]